MIIFKICTLTKKGLELTKSLMCYLHKTMTPSRVRERKQFRIFWREKTSSKRISFLELK